jgi:hypothetical protein
MIRSSRLRGTEASASQQFNVPLRSTFKRMVVMARIVMRRVGQDFLQLGEKTG